jgi:hypothetical protein
LGLGEGAETDNLTYRYVPLEESPPKLNRAVNELLGEVLRKTNEKLGARAADRASDAEAQLLPADRRVKPDKTGTDS